MDPVPQGINVAVDALADLQRFLAGMVAMPPGLACSCRSRRHRSRNRPAGLWQVASRRPEGRTAAIIGDFAVGDLGGYGQPCTVETSSEEARSHLQDAHRRISGGGAAADLTGRDSGRRCRSAVPLPALGKLADWLVGDVDPMALEVQAESGVIARRRRQHRHDRHRAGDQCAEARLFRRHCGREGRHELRASRDGLAAHGFRRCGDIAAGAPATALPGQGGGIVEALARA